MAAEDDIVQRIVLTGDKAAIAQFEAVGAAGSEAFAKVNATASATSKAFGSTGSAFAALLGNLRQTGHDSDEAAKGMENAASKGTSLATTLRLLGRGTHVRELSQLGRVLGVLGRAFTVAAPALLAVGLGSAAAFGAKAADSFADLAAETKVTTDQMADLQAAGSGVGLTLDESAKSFKAINDTAKQAAENVAKNDLEFRHLRTAIDDAKLAGDRMVEGFHKISLEGSNAFTEFTKASRKLTEDTISSGEQLTQGLRNIQEQRDALNGVTLSKDAQRARSLRNLDEQEKKLKEEAVKADRDRLDQQKKLNNDFIEGQRKRELELTHLNQEIAKNARIQKEAEEALKRAQIEAQKNATSFEKLGIATVDANNKLKDTPVLLSELADALHKVDDPLKAKELEFKLVAEGIDRKLIPALRRGSEGFKKLSEQNKKINPGFTPAQIKVADDFAIAMHQAHEALTALLAEMGLAIAPTFIPVFEKFRDILVQIRPGMVEFAKTFSGVIAPVLSAIGTLIQSIIIPAFTGLLIGLDAVAKKINEWTGSNVTGIALLTGIIIALLVAFGGIPLAISAVVIAFGLLLEWADKNRAILVLIGIVVAAVVAAFFSLPIAFALVVAATAFLIAKWDDLVATANSAATSMLTLWTNFKTRVVQLFLDIGKGIEDVWNRVKGKVQALLGFGGGGGAAAAGEPAPAFREGGRIRGPGGPRDDKVLMWGSNGEFMQPFAAVRKYGLGFMEAVRTLRFDPTGFDVGGLVGFNAPNPSMRFAQGGLINGGGGGILNLSIDGHSFDGLRAGQDTMDRLSKFATSKQIKSAGRKPAWVK